jgi:DNA repair exonuclease SbcCD nuclease subunit
MKVAIINDQHFGVRNDNLVLHSHFEKFYKECFFPRIDEEQIDTILILGDVFDRRKYINFDTLDRTRSYWFDEIQKRNITSHYVLGNHDVYFKSTNRISSPALLLRDYDNLFVYEEPTEIDLDGTTVLLLPWINNENYERSMEAIESSNASIVGAHLELRGFEMYRGAVNEHGLSHSTFAKFDSVFTGHFHHKSTKDNIHYLGAPYEMTWSDYDDPRGFHIYETRSQELTFVSNQFTIFNKVFYDDETCSENELIERNYSHIENTYVKVVVKNKNNPYLFDLFIDRINSHSPIQLQVVEDNFNLNLENEEDIISEAEDTMTIIQKYIKNLSLDNTATIEKLFHDLYADALSIE